MDRWYVVYTQARNEDRALWHLKNQGFHCFLPRFQKTRRHARKTHTVLEPLFPRYLFVRFDANASRWRAINGSRGVVSLLTDGKWPLAVPEAFVEKIAAGADEDGVTTLSRIGVLEQGRKVKITAGAFAGQLGEVADVIESGLDRIRILLSLLGVETSIEVPTYAVDAV